MNRELGQGINNLGAQSEERFARVLGIAPSEKKPVLASGERPKPAEAPKAAPIEPEKITEAPKAARIEPEKVTGTVSGIEAGTGSSYRDKFFGDKIRYEIIKKIAEEIYKRRMRDTDSRAVKEYEGLPLYGDEIDRVLRLEGIEKGTEDAEEFMQKWDWDQAVQIYERKYGKKVTETGADVSPISRPAVSDGIKKIDYDLLPEEEKDPARAIALHTFHKVKKLEELNAPRGEGDKRFAEISRKLWDEFTTHGFAETHPITGETVIKAQTDLDARIGIFLFRKAGFNVEKVKFVAQGAEVESGVGIDVGQEHGIVAKGQGRAAIGDHHTGESGRDSSAAKFWHEGLVKSGLLEQSRPLDQLINFVTKEDNKDYTDEECKQIVENFESNLIGLQRYMSGEQLLKVFEDYSRSGKKLNPYGKLPDEYLPTLNFETQSGKPMELANVIEKLSNIRDSAKRELNKIVKAGFVVDTRGPHGTILVDTGKLSGKSRRKKLSGNIGIEIARAAGYGGIVFWNPEANSFSVQTAGDINFVLPDGFNSRGRYWLKTPGEEGLNVSLEGILKKLVGKDDYKVEGALKAALGKGRVETEAKKEFTKEQRELFDNLMQKAKIGKIESKFLPNYEGMSDKKKKSWDMKKRSLDNVKYYLEKIARDIPENEAEAFRDVIMDGFLAEYYKLRGEKEKEIGTKLVKVEDDSLSKFKGEVLGEMRKHLTADFSENSVLLIVNYFRNYFNVEYLINN